MILRKANFPKQEYNRTFTQITTNDSRFYEDGEKTYPSVTYVLSYYPKGRHFEEWLKKNNKLGGQHKIPRLCNDRALINELLELNDSH